MYKKKDLCVMRRTTYKTFYIAVGTVHKTAHCTGHCSLKKKKAVSCALSSSLACSSGLPALALVL